MHKSCWVQWHYLHKVWSKPKMARICWSHMKWPFGKNCSNFHKSVFFLSLCISVHTSSTGEWLWQACYAVCSQCLRCRLRYCGICTSAVALLYLLCYHHGKITFSNTICFIVHFYCMCRLNMPHNKHWCPSHELHVWWVCDTDLYHLSMIYIFCAQLTNFCHFSTISSAFFNVYHPSKLVCRQGCLSFSWLAEGRE